MYNELWSSRTNEHAEKSVSVSMATNGNARKVCVGGTKVKLYQTKMETQSCKYGSVCRCILSLPFGVGKVGLLFSTDVRKMAHGVVHDLV